MNDVFFKCDATGCQVQYRNVDQRFKFYDVDENKFCYCLGCATNFGIPLGEEQTFKSFPQIAIDAEDGERLFKLTNIQMVSSLSSLIYDLAKEVDEAPEKIKEDRDKFSSIGVPELAPGGLDVLVLCESGLVSSVMLARRLSDIYPDNSYHTSSIHSAFNSEDYDLIVTLRYLLDAYSEKIQGSTKIIAISSRIFLPPERSGLFAIMDHIINLMAHTDDLDKKTKLYIESSLNIFDLFDMKRRSERDPLSSKLLLLPNLGPDPDAEAKKRQERLAKEWKPKSNIRPKKT